MKIARKMIAVLSLVIGVLFQVTMAGADFSESFANNVKYAILPRGVPFVHSDPGYFGSFSKNEKETVVRLAPNPRNLYLESAKSLSVAHGMAF